MWTKEKQQKDENKRLLLIFHYLNKELKWIKMQLVDICETCLHSNFNNYTAQRINNNNCARRHNSNWEQKKKLCKRTEAKWNDMK